ncbi:MAG TPA: hypothetical protein VM223_02325, partial [Planctomycetota bacterium]|nr:hypothetical protein [Planctomycetota bacterium]
MSLWDRIFGKKEEARIVESGRRVTHPEERAIPLHMQDSFSIEDDKFYTGDGIAYWESSFAYQQDPLFFNEVWRDDQVAACMDV